MIANVSLEKIGKTIQEADSILIFPHINPDDMRQLHTVEQRHHDIQKKDVKLFRATDRQQRIPIIEQLQLYRHRLRRSSY